MTWPLNPVLYQRLTKLFGRVSIANQGESFQQAAAVLDRAGRRVIIQSGEYYRINCPFCSQKTGARSADTKKRLWINHRWGTRLGDDDRGWYLWHCYNELCHEQPQFRKQLRDIVFRSIGDRAAIRILSGETKSQPLTAGTVWPGVCLPLTDLPSDHPAIVYLRDRRKFDPAELSRKFDIRFCVSPDPMYAGAVNRIVCPVYVGGRLVTWQCRYVGETDWKLVPKFYNQVSAHKAMTLYNFDLALSSPIVTIVEGPMDAWRLGTGAVALLGKTLSSTQVNVIRQHWKVAIVALDHDAITNSEKAVETLRRYMPTVMVRLPEGKDPDTMPTDDFWALVWQSAKSQNLADTLAQNAKRHRVYGDGV